MAMGKKIVYWQIINRDVGYATVGFWRKPTKSDIIMRKMVNISEKYLRNYYFDLTGLKEFDLIQVK